MLMLVVALVVCALFGVFAYAVMLQLDLIPRSSTQPRGQGPETLPPEGGGPRPLRRYGITDGPSVATRMGSMPQGCLVTILVVAAIWFLLWGIVLILALRILTSPY